MYRPRQQRRVQRKALVAVTGIMDTIRGLAMADRGCAKRVYPVRGRGEAQFHGRD